MLTNTDCISFETYRFTSYSPLPFSSLTAKRYHNGDSYPTWADSDIREWLNGQFLRSAFTEREQAVILRADISTPDYEGIEGGPDTRDRVFLLSRTEAAAYFAGSADRLVKATDADKGIWYLR